MTAFHVKFPSIDQYRSVVKAVRDRAAYHQVPIPALKFTGAVKLHGTNAGVVLDLATGELWAQSRELIITPEQDNAGFAKFVAAHDAEFRTLFEKATLVAHKLNGTHVAIYGEWCGQGIAKGDVAINKLSKRFVIFKVRIFTKDDLDGQTDAGWLTADQVNLIYDSAFNCPDLMNGHLGLFYSIYKFQTWELTIDFLHPDVAQNELVDRTVSVELECPVGKAFGVLGVGEGIVWTCADSHPAFRTCDLIFKVKGAKHSDSKTKNLAPVDPVKVAGVRAFAEMVVTDHRLEKMLELMLMEHPLKIESMGHFLKLVGQDVLKEESDTLEASKLEKRDVMPSVSALAKAWFIKKLNDDAGLS